MHRYWIAKFMCPLLFVVLGALLPNSWFFAISALAVLVSCFFLCLQMMLLLDIGYVWNDLWIENALEEQRQDVDATGRAWFIALIVFGALFCGSGLFVTIWLNVFYHASLAIVVILWVIFAVNAGLLVLSVTEWCKHG